MTPYLSFTGNCEEALDFYSSALGGKVEGVHRYEGSPMESDVPADFKNKIMHATFNSPLGTFMASDTSRPLGDGNRISLSINPASADAQRIFDRLSEGGQALMPLQDVFWGGKFGMLTDRYGFHWQISAE